MSKSGLLLGALSLITAASVHAGTAPQRQAAIDHANQGGIADWYASDDSGIFVMDRTGRWYRAEFVGSCPRVTLQNTIAFRTSVTGRLDALGSVVTADGVCPLRSLTRSERPAAKGRKGRP